MSQLRYPTEYHLQHQQQEQPSSGFYHSSSPEFSSPGGGFMSPPPPLLDDFEDLEYQSAFCQQANHNMAFSPPTSTTFGNSSGSNEWASTTAMAMSAPAHMYHPHHYFSGSPPSCTMGTSFEEDYSAQMSLQSMMDKRRRRRESHNAVERRRRDNINERIQELGTLLPESMLENTGHARPNKGTILKKSVEHIKLLQQEAASYQERIRKLEQMLADLQQH